MRWFWPRRRQKQAAAQTPPVAAATIPAPASTIQRAPASSGRLGQPRQLSSELLVLARDYLQAAGGRVRVEDEDVLSATLPNGRLVRYTTTQAKAHVDESMTLLVEGSEALAAMLDDIAAHARITVLQLVAAADPVTLALDACAAPASACGRCLDATNASDGAYAAICPVCPRREGCLVLRWRTRGPREALSARVIQQEQAASVELAYLVAARDRHGRRDEWIRHAVDVTTGQEVPVVSEAALAVAEAGPIAPDHESMLMTACGSAEHALGEPLAAVGLFLRQRSLDEYRRRLEEVATTFDRLQHESPETARAVKAGRSRELSALADVYAVDVEAHLESACLITSPHATVAIRPQKGHGELLLRVDVGRQHVLPPECATCGAAVHVGHICDAGHVVCAHCAAACSHCGAWRCVACGEEPASGATCLECGRPHEATTPPPVTDDQPAQDGAFTVRHLDALPPEMWCAAIEWLLTCQGMSVDTRRITGELAHWQAHGESGAAVVAALRPGLKRMLDEADIRQAAAHLAPEQSTATRMILSTAPASASASDTARQLHIHLVDRGALQGMLANLATAHDRERERELAENQARAEAASATRQAMLDTLDAVEHALAPLRRSRRASAQPATSAAASHALASARTALERAALAWETLLAEWSASFGERPARNGSLVLLAESSQFAELAERAGHLREALLDATSLLAQTPARGEAGYTAWRQAIIEECAARYDAWRWRIRTYEPGAWSDFSRGWNSTAAAKAAEATTTAGHATARADKAQAQALRAG